MKNFISVLIVLTTVLNGWNPGDITVDNIAKFLEPEAEVVAEFISSNLELFANEYNKAIGDKTQEFYATACEYQSEVYVTTLQEKEIYLDFNEDNGYMIIKDDYEVVEFETKGDLAYLREEDDLFYSLYDGFLYYDENQNMVPYDNTRGVMSQAEANMGAGYSGQKEGTDGTIYNPTAYVKDKYGSEYKLYDSNILSDFEYFTQYDLSLYRSIGSDGLKYSENNCVLASIFSLMNYLKISHKYNGLPSSSSTIICYAKKDSFYEDYAKRDDYSVLSNLKMPRLYYNIRHNAIKEYGYETGPVNPFDICDMIKSVGSNYGADIDTNHILIWSYEAQVVDEIDSGYPTIWNMMNSSSYGSHTTVVTGYKTYRKTTTILGIKFYDYVELLALADNWDDEPMYFDFTSYNAVGSFVKVR